MHDGIRRLGDSLLYILFSYKKIIKKIRSFEIPFFCFPPSLFPGFGVIAPEEEVPVHLDLIEDTTT